jgi:hypothetical protein
MRRRVPSTKRTAIHSGRRARRWLFNRRLVARSLRREHVLCLGDSHTAVFRDVKIPGLWFLPHGVGGATASGILNPLNKSESFKIFTGRLQRAPRWQNVLLLLGEVDCGFLIWHRARRLGLGVTEQLTLTLDAYAAFIGRVVDDGFARVMVLSAPPPTISDYPEGKLGPVARLRSDVTASLIDRTDLTLRFNQELSERCAAVGATFVDVTTRCIDGETGVIRPEFVRANSSNHHLARAPYSQLISESLFPIWPARGAGGGTRVSFRTATFK